MFIQPFWSRKIVWKWLQPESNRPWCTSGLGGSTLERFPTAESTSQMCGSCINLLSCGIVPAPVTQSPPFLLFWSPSVQPFLRCLLVQSPMSFALAFTHQHQPLLALNEANCCQGLVNLMLQHDRCTMSFEASDSVCGACQDFSTQLMQQVYKHTDKRRQNHRNFTAAL